MANVPDKAILNFHLLTPAEIKVYSYYCKARNKESGGWVCSDLLIADQMHLSRARVTEARNGLKAKGWIRIEEKNFIIPVFGFDENVEISTNSPVENLSRIRQKSRELDKNVENSTNGRGQNVENSTKNVENSTQNVENSTKSAAHIRNLLPPLLPPLLPEGEPRAREPANGQPTAADFGPPQNGPEPRFYHPALAAIREITKHSPDRVIWDDLIATLGSDFDRERLDQCYRAWRLRGFRTNNYGWVTDWYVNGIREYAAAANGIGKVPDRDADCTDCGNERRQRDWNGSWPCPSCRPLEYRGYLKERGKL